MRVEEITRELETMAILNGVARQSAVKAERLDCKRRRRDGSFLRYYRIVWFINGNKCTRKDAARFLSE